MPDARTSWERALLEKVADRGALSKLSAWVRLSGPGWLQSAITLGGGSLASALYLGVLGGFHMLWLQVLVMALGVIMLAAISHVTLTTGRRPFRTICQDVNPVLGWGWILAVILANVVWSLPQFSLGAAAVQQNLLPELAGEAGRAAVCAVVLILATVIVWSYDSGLRGVRIFEIILKAMVGMVVCCFFGVVVALAVSPEGLPWDRVLGGFVPDPSLIFEPAQVYREHLNAAGMWTGFWTERIVREQRDVMIAAAATAVGINMTFLLPYSMLRKGWGRAHRGLAIFDLGTGLLVPFVLATSCVVIASASRFHGHAAEEVLQASHAPANLVAGFEGALKARLEEEMGRDAVAGMDPAELKARMDAIPGPERRLAAMLVRRDAFDLADALRPLTGRAVSQYVFGLGVLGMAVSTVIILMLISGFAVCEALGMPAEGRTFRLAALLPGLGVLGPFVWKGDARFWLAVPTSVFGMILLPVAYWTFLLMMNSRRVMGEDRPRRGARVCWNVLMLIAALLVTPASLYSAWRQAGVPGLIAVGAFVLLAAFVHFRGRRASTG